MKLSLKRITENDLELIMNWRMLPEVTKYMYTDPNLTMEDQIKWFKKISSDSTTSYWLIVFEGKKVGVIDLYDIDHHNKRCFWGYYIADTSVRGKGLGRNLECNMYDLVLDKMGFNKLCCEVLAFNKRVIEIHKHFGSEIEGVFRKHIYKSGSFHDVVRMAILREKWLNIRANYEYEPIEIEVY